MKLPLIPSSALLFLSYALAASASVPGEREFHAPITLDAPDFTPRPQTWSEPRRLGLPSDEKLTTVEIRDRTFNIKRVSSRAQLGKSTRAAVAVTPGGLAVHEKDDEALFFLGSGGGGRFSNERLIVENCNFIIDFEEGDFEEWDPRRSAIYVEGYKEVVVRNCVFLSKATKFDPMRKVVASVTAYDCLRVEIENSYFEGRTIGWRGHINIYCSGPTSIRNVEINGLDQAAGGIWVATGVGEGKIGWIHQNEPEKMIYPAGPLLVENCWVHDQKGDENSDGIYVQSIQPYLIRNTKVENWGPDDSLIDVGFRDTAGKTHNCKPLANHGGLGVIENCEFAKGYVKDSVGIAGGLVFRHNLVRDGAWFFPYVFDGGSWFVVSNEFRDQAGVIVSGRNNQLSGWTPKEGMFAKGSQMVLFNNQFKGKPGVAPKALYVGGAAPGPLKEVIRADHNAYAFDTPPAKWGEGAKNESDYATLDDWRTATGNDRNSVLSATASVAAFARVPADTLKLPGGLAMNFGPFKAGLTGPVGVQHTPTRERAARASQALSADYARRHFNLEAETLKSSGTDAAKIEKRSWASAGAYVVAALGTGETIDLAASVPEAASYLLSTVTPGSRKPGTFQFLVNGEPLGKPFRSDRKNTIPHGVAMLPAGGLRFSYRSVEGGELLLDAIGFRDGVAHEREQARQDAVAAAREKAKAQKADIEERKIRHELSALPLVGPAPGSYTGAEVKGVAYRLLVPKGDTARLSWRVPSPAAPGRFAVYAVFFQQQDKARVKLFLDGAPVGEKEFPVTASTRLGEVELPEADHLFTLEFSGYKPGAKLRLQRIDLLPLDEATADPSA
ncbi:MAG: hypothetical protein H7Y06_11230 [Opitutaceae bacterium]|nr:hypothetical protein [Opitutaceae bacterium]